MQITDLKKEQQIPNLFRLGFRPLFLFGSLFSVLAVAIWGLSLQGLIEFNPYGGSYWWHGHEMLFGFVSAIIVGFLLTAVQNWTGVPGLRGKPLMGLFALWLVARIGLMLPQSSFSMVIALLDVAFMPVAAYLLSRPLIAVKQQRNMIFIPVLALFAVANVMTHAAVWQLDMSYFKQGIQLVIFLVTLVMVIVAGRVMPMFTANGTQTTKVQPLAWLETAAIASVIILLALQFLSLLVAVPPQLMAAAFLFAGLANLARCLRWRIWVTVKVPLVWSLHLAYYCIVFGLLLMAWSYLDPTLLATTALHLLTVGGMGGLILAMISRVSLGHTGRPLTLAPLMPWALLSLFLAAMVRAIGVLLLPQLTSLWLTASVALWLVAYGLFLWCYFPLLSQPRADGRPG